MKNEEIFYWRKRLEPTVTASYRAEMGSYREQKSVSRMLTLDAMRGGAALAVVMYHALGVAPQTAFSGWEWWLPQIAAGLVHFAYAGIYLFFVISGFCIHLFWAKARSAGVDRPLDRGSLSGAWGRRLYPSYLCRSHVDICVTSRIKLPFHVTGFSRVGPSCFTCSCYTTWTVRTVLHHKHVFLDTCY